jgi:16S rRNA (guanine966-N2)-methyltransferase|tara:strand:+ start:452 stop:1021 length:570 start_codon:yes stop_codon:yes gene_type:complete
MRIISGLLKGSTLHIPKNKNTRPLKDLVRESIFNLLIHSKKINLNLDNANILDLYAGTGSFGLECFSRNAKYIYFVENEKFALEILKKNIKKLKIEKNIKIYSEDVLKIIEKIDTTKFKIDLIFCDPPFAHKNIDKLVELIFKKKLLNKNGIIILHRNKVVKDKLPDYLNILEERIYGISKIIFANFLP